MQYHDGESVPAQVVESQTSQGIAKANLIIDQSGEINIRAESGQAVTSDVLLIEIPPESITSTPLPPTQTSTLPSTPTLTPTNTPSPSPTASPTPVNIAIQGNVDFGDWLVSLLLVAMISGGNYWIMNSKRGLRWGVRAALIPFIGGLLAYTYLAINMPGSETMTQNIGIWGVLIVTTFGAAIGVGAVIIWQMVENRKVKPA
jgi:hypothetical protein